MDEDPYEEGIAAFHEGKGLEDNPYSFSIRKNQQWEDGWLSEAEGPSLDRTVLGRT